MTILSFLGIIGYVAIPALISFLTIKSRTRWGLIAAHFTMFFIVFANTGLVLNESENLNSDQRCGTSSALGALGLFIFMTIVTQLL